MAITSTRNPLVREVVGLHATAGRRSSGEVLLEGPTIVGDAVRSGLRPRLILTTAPDRWEGSADRVVAVSGDVLAKVATTRSPQDPVAVVRRPDRPASGERRLVAWGIADPGNLGTMIRTAAAIGVDVAVGGPGSADPWSPKAVRAGAGAHFLTGIVEVAGIEDALGARPGLALVVAGGTGLDAVDGSSWALVVGSEAHGLPTDVVDRCRSVTLPMPGGTESLNAAVAASIALYSLAT